MYQIEETPYGQVIRRLSDMACIPNDYKNRDYLDYLEWVKGKQSTTD